ncbi:MAG: DUF6252 family protein [Prolixibacteraceae bacterium]|jgi:hypothetical protein|nr:DUF6252 family protein [Prolixibacteraceae bacterium]
MKKLLFVLCTVLLISSCSKKENNDQTDPLRGVATFTVNNVDKSFTKANNFNEGVLALANSKEEMIALFFPKPTDKTTFPITYNLDSEDLVTATYTLGEKTYNATNGVLGIGKIGQLEITVTSYDGTRISGTFMLTLVNKDKSDDVIKITKGKFEKIPNLMEAIKN